jgi:hypothetical protein
LGSKSSDQEKENLRRGGKYKTGSGLSSLPTKEEDSFDKTVMVADRWKIKDCGTTTGRKEKEDLELVDPLYGERVLALRVRNLTSTSEKKNRRQ